MSASTADDDAKLSVADTLWPWHPSASTDPAQYGTIDLRGGDAIDPDGRAVVLVVAGRADRIGLRKRLRDSGVVVRATVLMVPAWPHTHHLLSVTRSLSDGIARHLDNRLTTRAVGLISRVRVGRGLIQMLAPSIGLIAVRGDDEHTPSWSGLPVGATFHVSRRPRRDAQTTLVLIAGTHDARPTRVAKSARTRSGFQRVDNEARALETLAPIVRQCGLATPTLIHSESGLLVMSVVDGRSIDRRYRPDDTELWSTIDVVLDGVERWHRLTQRTLRVGDAVGVGTLTDDLGAIVAVDPSLEEYAHRMEQFTATLAAQPANVVDRHGDLTIANVVISDEGDVGLLDWESARQRAFPETDAWYLVVDALAFARSSSHAEALDMILDSSEPLARHLRSRLERLSSAPRQISALGVHVAFIGHAANEVRRSSTTGRFVKVLRRLASATTPDGLFNQR